jgi:hypothetical protein
MDPRRAHAPSWPSPAPLVRSHDPTNKPRRDPPRGMRSRSGGGVDAPHFCSAVRCGRQGPRGGDDRNQARLSHKSAATAVCCRILQWPADARAFGRVDSPHSRVGRHHIRELVGDFSNALDLCDSLRPKRRPARRAVQIRADGLCRWHLVLYVLRTTRSSRVGLPRVPVRGLSSRSQGEAGYAQRGLDPCNGSQYGSAYVRSRSGLYHAF